MEQERSSSDMDMPREGETSQGGQSGGTGTGADIGQTGGAEMGTGTGEADTGQTGGMGTGTGEADMGQTGGAGMGDAGAPSMGTPPETGGTETPREPDDMGRQGQEPR